MGFVIPFINRDLGELKTSWRTRIQEESVQKTFVLIIVSIALLLDNMLYMVIVPIIPDFFRRTLAYEPVYDSNGTITEYIGEDQANGWLFASKAILQLIVNPFSGTLIDRIGYEVPMMIGLSVMFLSTSLFAIGKSWGLLFTARCIQGLGSAFADTSGLAMIADRYTEEQERSKALGIAIAFISFGSLVAPPFGGWLYQWTGVKAVPFVLLAVICLVDAIMAFMVIHPKVRRTETGERIKGTPIWRLFMDPYIAICAGALVMANISLAAIEPNISLWMEAKMGATTLQAGMVWLPAFFPHVAGVYFTIYFMRKYPGSPWALAIGGLVIEALSCLILAFCKTIATVIIPLCILCFGIALIDTAVLPLLGYLVDTRHVSVYGSVYAIADISYCLAYAFGPVISGGFLAVSTNKALYICVFVLNSLYAPIIYKLKNIYQYDSVEGAAQELKTAPGYGTTDDTYQNGTEGPQKPKETVEYKKTLYEKKVKKDNPYRGFKDTDAILGSEEEEEEEEEPDPELAKRYKQYQGAYQGY